MSLVRYTAPMVNERPRRNENPKELAHRIAKGYKGVITDKEKLEAQKAAQGRFGRIKNFSMNRAAQAPIDSKRDKLGAELSEDGNAKWKTITKLANEENEQLKKAREALKTYAQRFHVEVGEPGFKPDPGVARFNVDPNTNDLRRSVLEAIAMESSENPDILKPRGGFEPDNAVALSKEAKSPFVLLLQDLSKVDKGSGGMQGEAKSYSFPLTPEIISVVAGEYLLTQPASEDYEPSVPLQIERFAPGGTGSAYRFSLFRYN